jgi:branched-chain amino acid transport system substrate-binding protein
VLNSKALTKIQSTILITIIIIAAISGFVGYSYLNNNRASTNIIRIGICGDIDNTNGQLSWQGAVLAAEQINAEGGILGRQLEIVAEDSDTETMPFDIAVATNAITKLITVDKADFIIASTGALTMVLQDVCADHKKVFFSLSPDDELTQRVADNYDRYKGFFRIGLGNITSSIIGSADSILTLRDYTGFSKVAIVEQDFPIFTQLESGVETILQENGVEVVNKQAFPPSTSDFTSVFAKAEDSGAEIMVVYTGVGAGLVKEYADRQSPFVVWGLVGGAGFTDFWNLTEGKCDSVSFVGYPVVSGYPLTSKTLPTREAFLERWGELPNGDAAATYDLLRFILPDAIKRAGTIEYDAIITALEHTDVETSLAKRSVFTSTHDVMVGADLNNPGDDYVLVCLFQWQDGKQVPVYPIELLQDAGATYKFPAWEGPWSSKQTP